MLLETILKTIKFKDIIMWWLQILGSGSIGSLITILLNFHFKRKNDEKKKQEDKYEKSLHQLYSPLYLYLVILIKCLSEILNHLKTSWDQTDTEIKIKINLIKQYHVRVQEINEKVFLLLGEKFGYLHNGDDLGLIQYLEFSEKINNIEWSNVKKIKQVEGLITAYEMIIKLLDNIKYRSYVSVCENRYYLGFESFDESIERLGPLIKKTTSAKVSAK